MKVDIFFVCIKIFLNLIKLNELSLSVGMSLMMQVATELKVIAKDFNVAVLVSNSFLMMSR